MMQQWIKWCGGAVLAGSLVLLFVCNAQAQEVTRKTFTVAPGGTLDLQTDVGAVEVRTGAGDQLRVEVEQRVDASWGRRSAREIRQHFAVTTTQRDGTVRVEGRYLRDAQGRLQIQGGEMSRLQVRYIIYVPARFHVQVQTGSGPIEVGDLRGDVRVQTGSGAIRLGDIDGDVTAQTAAGHIRVGDVSGDADLQAAAGTVQTGRIRGRRTGQQ